MSDKKERKISVKRKKERKKEKKKERKKEISEVKERKYR